MVIACMAGRGRQQGLQAGSPIGKLGSKEGLGVESWTGSVEARSAWSLGAGGALPECPFRSHSCLTQDHHPLQPSASAKSRASMDTLRTMAGVSATGVRRGTGVKEEEGVGRVRAGEDLACRFGSANVPVIVQYWRPLQQCLERCHSHPSSLLLPPRVWPPAEPGLEDEPDAEPQKCGAVSGGREAGRPA